MGLQPPPARLGSGQGQGAGLARPLRRHQGARGVDDGKADVGRRAPRRLDRRQGGGVLSQDGGGGVEAGLGGLDLDGDPAGGQLGVKGQVFAAQTMDLAAGLAEMARHHQGIAGRAQGQDQDADADPGRGADGGVVGGASSPSLLPPLHAPQVALPPKCR